MILLAEVEATGGSSGIGGVVGGIAGATLSAWLAGKMRHSKVEFDGTHSALIYSKVYLILGWITVGFFGTAAIGSQFSGENERVKIMCLGIFGGFSLLGLMMIAMYYRCRITWQGEELRCRRLLGRPMDFTWKDVTRVKFAGMAQWWILFLRDGRKVRVSTYMGGAAEFMKQVRERAEVFVPPGILPNREKIEF